MSEGIKQEKLGGEKARKTKRKLGVLPGTCFIYSGAKKLFFDTTTPQQIHPPLPSRTVP